MPDTLWKSAVFVLLEAFFVYGGGCLIVPSRVVNAYVQWGFPPWAHFVAGAAFLTTAILLPFRRTRWSEAVVSCCVLALAAATCALNGDYAHAVQGLPLIALIPWAALRPRTPARV